MNRLRIATRSVRRESAHGYGYALRWFLLRFYLRFLRRRRDTLPPASADDERHPITIVIPAVDKDADVLGACLRSVRTHVRNQVAALWVVAPESPAIRALADEAGATLVPEDSLLPRPARELKTRGWVLQQLIKLNACFHVPTADYLVLDADTVFLRPQCFMRAGKAVLRYSDQYELLYNRSLQLVFGHARRFPVSFVTHHQLFNVDRVKGLLALFERRFGRTWWEAILHEVDQGHLISFSEYELYGHFVMAAPDWRSHVALQYWHGLDLDRADLPGLGAWQAGGPGLNSVSFHRHTQ